MVTFFITKRSKLRRAAAADIRPSALAGLRAGLLGSALVCASLLTPIDPATAQTCPPTPSLAPTLPDDVCGPASVRPTHFYGLAWQLFTYLVWPAEAGSRGKPDLNRPLNFMEGARVFETFKADWEVFQQGAPKPVDWDVYPSKPCSNDPSPGKGELVLASTNKFDILSPSGRNENAPVLIAQNGTFVRYQASFNKIIFDKIKTDSLYDNRVIPPTEPGDDESIAEVTSQKHGAMMLKSSWIEFPGNGTIDPSKFYVRRDAWVQVPGTTECRRASVGLVGLHIVYKTEISPQWIWSTFEHVDNVPEPGDDARKHYTFNNGDARLHMTDRLQPEHRAAAALAGNAQPYQVERRQELDRGVLSTNRTWQAEFGRVGSVWQNYKLVLSQWPQSQSAPSQGVRTRTIEPDCGPGSRSPATANVTMETFQQDCKKSWTCLGCHNNFRGSDFIAAIDLNRFPREGEDSGSRRGTAVKRIEDIINSLGSSQ